MEHSTLGNDHHRQRAESQFLAVFHATYITYCWWGWLVAYYCWSL